jgi:hypothetical protein
MDPATAVRFALAILGTRRQRVQGPHVARIDLLNGLHCAAAERRVA